ncbi:replication protein C, IncQ-type [Polaromonas naphthalenivorans]|uniref:Plasmid and phage iteron-binding protein n=1 Tax=Polaromonas naphthalenivorans (strain CJ2) TaxID=365044 RepID=A1VX74_POLNA|nr:replication protein C, IncQ-type [Polaromonas naphthalenivorans]ABM40252.1 plasmid and phage iteron-binding protein [Polaromonas naphthalenivorans CJ2]
MKPKQNLDHIRHEPGHVLAPGLFRSLKKGDYKRLKLDIAYEFGKGERLEFKGAEPLGVPELRILQGLIGMAGPNGLLLTPEPKTESGQQLRLLLETKFDAIETNALVVKGSYRALAKTIGYADIENTKNIQESIERLWGVSVIARKGGKHMGFRLLSEYASDDADGRLYVALNPVLARAILGEAQHCRISLDEVRALKTDPARLMHQRLCGWIDIGKSGKTTIETLCGYIWLDEATPEAMKKRKQAVRRALKEMEALGWKVTEYINGKFEITRPEIG